MKLWPRVGSFSCIIERALLSSIASSMLIGRNGVFGGMLPLSIRLADRLSFNVLTTAVGIYSANLTRKVWRRYGYTGLESMYHMKYKNIHFTFLDVITHLRFLPAINSYLLVFCLCKDQHTLSFDLTPCLILMPAQKMLLNT
jgi:hypothetical protein